MIKQNKTEAEAPKKEELKPGCICNNINISQISYNEKLGIYSNCTHSWSEPKEGGWKYPTLQPRHDGESLQDFFYRAKLSKKRRDMLEQIKIGLADVGLLSHKERGMVEDIDD